MGALISLLLIVCALYLALVTALYLFQRNFLYLPFGGEPDVETSGVPEMTAVRLKTADGLDLLAWWRPPLAPDRPTLIYFHGNGGDIGLRGGKLRFYLDAGFGVLLPAYRGYSGNPGTPTEAGLYMDGRAALDFVAAVGIESERLVLYGESLGSGVAVQMATERSVAAVVLEAPFSSVADIAQARFPWIPARWLVRDRFDSVAKIVRIGAPLLIVHGDRDLIVPLRFGQRLYRAAAEPKTFVRLTGVGHNDLYAFGAAFAILEFVGRTLRVPVSG